MIKVGNLVELSGAARAIKTGWRVTEYKSLKAGIVLEIFRTRDHSIYRATILWNNGRKISLPRAHLRMLK